VTQYRKKPVVIEAVHFTSFTVPAAREFLGEDYLGMDGDKLIIRTAEGPMNASPNDYIIRGVKGEHYACKPDIFRATYEPVEPDPDDDNGEAAALARGDRLIREIERRD
jgi:hypothetical protein